MKRMSIKTKRASLALISVVFAVLVINLYGEWGIFGEYDGAVFFIFFVSVMIYCFFVRPTVFEIQDHIRAKSLESEEQEMLHSRFRPSLRTKIVSLFLLVLVITVLLADFVRGWGLFDGYDGVITFVLFVSILIYGFIIRPIVFDYVRHHRAKNQESEKDGT